MERSKMKGFVNHTCVVVVMRTMNLRQKPAEQRAEDYVDTAVKILIAVVLGALLLVGLYVPLSDTVLPTLIRRVQEMFDYAG